MANHPWGLDLEVETHFHSDPPTWNPVSVHQPKEGWTYFQRRNPYSDFEGEGLVDAPPLYIWDPSAHYFAGIGYDTITNNWTSPGGKQILKRITHVVLPYWLIVLTLLAPGILAMARRFRLRTRLRSGRCISCGYDLRGSPDRCPECGKVAARTISA